MKVTVECAESKVKRQLWETNVSVEHYRDPCIVVTFWGDQERPTSRHKWRNTSSPKMYRPRCVIRRVLRCSRPPSSSATGRTMPSYVIVEDSHCRTFLKQVDYGFVAEFYTDAEGLQIRPCNRGVDMAPALLKRLVEECGGGSKPSRSA